VLKQRAVTKWRAGKIRALCILGTASLVSGLAVAAPAYAAPSAATQNVTKSASAPQRAVYQTAQQAEAQAERTGKAVPVTGATTAASTLTANPNGTYTLAEDAAPARAKVNGVWENLNPDLVRNADGTYSPAVSSEPLALSGGGTGPLATMSDGRYSLSLTAPARLPAPVVSGATATYDAILPGVDLIITAQATGGYREDLRVDSRAAAGNPALASFTFRTSTRGLTVKAGPRGSIEATGPLGQAVFSAPAPRMWDSATAAGVRTATVAGMRLDLATGRVAASTALVPGEHAHSAALGVSVGRGTLTLTPAARC
jgi:hypothetical protein